MTMTEREKLPDEIEALRAEIDEPEKPESDSTDIDISWGDLLGLAFRSVFDVLAPAWAVSDTEVTQLAQAWVPVAEKYFPDTKAGVEINALLATALILAPRLNTPPKNKPAKREPATYENESGRATVDSDRPQPLGENDIRHSGGAWKN